ncbi:M20/M25/M40 family metallo-hydrolase [Lachnospiraceae bacterium 54-53]
MKRVQIDQFIQQHKEEAIALLEELGKIPAPSHKEDKRAAFCKRWFERKGCNEVCIDEAKSVICNFNCDKYEDMIVLMAHTDVVFDDMEELPMRRQDNILAAPGIGDDTSNLVNLMMGAAFLVEYAGQLKIGVMVVANSCEEGLGNLKGCKEIFNNYGNRIKAFYSFDGYMSMCTSIPVGSHRYRIQVLVRGGHSYQNFGRDNAIHIAAQIIDELYRIDLPKEEVTTYNVGKISGGTTVNSIPQEAVILYEYRSSSEKCLQKMQKKFHQVIDKFRMQGKKINVEILGIRPGVFLLIPLVR